MKNEHLASLDALAHTKHADAAARIANRRKDSQSRDSKVVQVMVWSFFAFFIVVGIVLWAQSGSVITASFVFGPVIAGMLLYLDMSNDSGRIKSLEDENRKLRERLEALNTSAAIRTD